MIGTTQLDFGFKRPVRQRKKRRGRPLSSTRVSHRPRAVRAPYPVHLTLRVRRDVWRLRSPRAYGVILRALCACAQVPDRRTRLVHFSVQHNHIHVIAESSDTRQLGRVMQAVAIRIARGLNKRMGRHGAVFADRYHSRALLTPTETRRAIVYVLQNARKHLIQQGYPLSAHWIDVEFSSALWFGGWKEPVPTALGPPPVADPDWWLLKTGWWLRGGGPISRREIPAT